MLLFIFPTVSSAKMVEQWQYFHFQDPPSDGQLTHTTSAPLALYPFIGDANTVNQVGKQIAPSVGESLPTRIRNRAKIYDVVTGIEIPNNSIVNTGTKIEFRKYEIPYNHDILSVDDMQPSTNTWGHWTPNAAFPPGSNIPYDPSSAYNSTCWVFNYWGSYIIPKQNNPFVSFEETSQNGYLIPSAHPSPLDVVFTTGASYATFSGCNANNTICTVANPGLIKARVYFMPTNIKYYFRYNPGTVGFVIMHTPIPGIPNPYCIGNNIPLKNDLGVTDWFTGKRSVTFNLTAVGAPNTAPNTPTFTLAPTTGSTGINYTFKFKASDPDGDTIRYEIDWNNDGVVNQIVPGSYVASNTVGSASKSWASAGTHTFKVRAIDSTGSRSGWVSHTINISITPPPNSQPQVTLSSCAASPGVAGGNYTYNISATDIDGDPLAYTIDWDDLSPVSTGSGGGHSDSHSWGSPGSYNVVITVSDGVSTPVNVSCPTMVINTPTAPTTPTISVSPVSASIDTNDTITLTINSTDTDSPTLNYYVDWGDGFNSTYLSEPQGVDFVTPPHPYTSPGTYTAEVVASDGSLTSIPSTVTITVNNDNPVIDTFSGYPGATDIIVEGTDVTLSLKASDSNNDTLTYTVDWGEGSPVVNSGLSSGTSISNSHIYSSGGTYTITYTVNDPYSGSDARTAVVNVNRPPVMTSVAQSAGVPTEYFEVTFAFSATDADGSDPSLGEMIYYEVDWDGDEVSPFVNVPSSGTVISGSPGSSSYIWTTPGSYTIKVRAIDNSGTASAWMPRNIIISAINPTTSITSSVMSIRAGNTVNISWSASDVTSCDVTGPFASPLPTYPGPNVSGNENVLITAKSVFTITCDAPNGLQYSNTVIVNLLPSFKEE